MNGRLAQSSLQTSLVLGLRVVTQAIVLVLLARLLGPGLYGNFAAVASLAVVLGLIPNLGAGFVMLARSVRDESGIAEVWRYAWPVTGLLGFLLLALYVVAGSFITNPQLPVHVLLLLGAAELLVTPFTLLLSFALQARDKVPLSQLVLWIPLGLRVLAALPCFLLDQAERISAYVALQLLVSLLGAGLGFLIIRRHVRLDWRPRRPTRAELRDGGSYAAMHLVAANPSELDKIIAVRAIGAHDAGIYAATSRAMAATVMPVVALLLSSQPRLFKFAFKPTHEGRRLVTLIAILALGWGLGSGALLVLCSPLLPVLFGQSFSATATLMPWLAMVAPFLSLRLAAGTILAALGRPLERIAFELGGMLVLTAGMLLLAPHFGVRGLATALLISEATMATSGWLLAIRRLPVGIPG